MSRAAQNSVLFALDLLALHSLHSLRGRADRHDKTGKTMARPKKEMPELRNRKITVRFSDDEAQNIQSIADSIKLKPADYCRRAVLGKNVSYVTMPEVSEKAYIELARIGNNLNQIAKKLNEGSTATIEDLKEIQALKETVRQLQRDIIAKP